MIRRVDQGFRLDRVAGSKRWKGVAARPGILTYGSVRELVRPEVLAASAAQLRGRPVTLAHPASGKAGSSDRVGLVLDAHVDSTGALVVELEITDPGALAAIERGDMVELSPGYDADTGPGGVDPRFGPYDSEQRGRVYDHLAVVERARCGPSCALHTDARGSCTCRSDAATKRRPTANQLHRTAAAEARARALGIQVRADADERLTHRPTANEAHLRAVAAARADADEQHRKAAAEARARAQGRPLPAGDAPVARPGRRPTANEEHAARVAAARAAAEGTGGTGGSGR